VAKFNRNKIDISLSQTILLYIVDSERNFCQ